MTEEYETIDALRAERDTLRAELARLQQQSAQQAEDALRESEARYRLLADNATDLISRHSPDGIYLYASPAALAVLGYTPEELVGRNSATLFHPDDLASTGATLAQVLQSTNAMRSHYRIIRKDGRVIWLETTGKALRDPQSGAVVEVIAVSRDITERIMMEEALRASETRYRSIFMHAPLAIGYADSDGTILDANPAYVAMFGYRLDELQRIAFADFTHPDDLAGDLAQFHRLFAGSIDEYRLDKRFVRKDGQIVWTRIAVSLVRDSGNEPQYVIGMIEDITERKHAEDALRESERRFRMLSENAQDILYRFRLLPTPGFEYISPSITAIFGYTPAEYYADYHIHTRAIHPESRALFDAFRQSPESWHEPLILRYIRKDGRDIWIEQRQWQVFDEHGTVVGIEGITRDITERKRIEAHLLQQQQAMAMLRERERLARELHDTFGQVLGYVNTQTQTIRSLLASEQYALSDMHLHNLAMVTHETYTDIREFILGVRSGGTLEHGFFPSVERYLQRYEQIYGITTTLMLPAELRDTTFAPAVEAHLVRIIQEALTNARKHADPSTVRVTFALLADQVHLVVEDNGCGFDMGKLPNVANGERYGLHSMRERTREIGGSFTIDTAPGAGTRVIIHVPLVPPDTLLMHGVKVMLVDDQPLFLEGMHNMLAARGIAVIATARNGEEAQEKARIYHPDIILMDVDMPLCNGLEATRRIKAELPDIQIVMLTVSDQDEHLFEAIKYGAAGYLLKDLDASDFFNLLAELEQGEVALSPGLAKKLMHEFSQRSQHATSEAVPPPPPPPAAPDDALTDLEREILVLVAQSYTYRDVGERVGYSERSIKKFMSQIIKKLHLSNRAAAIAYARQHGLVP